MQECQPGPEEGEEERMNAILQLNGEGHQLWAIGRWFSILAVTFQALLLLLLLGWEL